MSSQPTCEQRVESAWAGRLEDLERFMVASYAEGVFDDNDSDFDDCEIVHDEAADYPWGLFDPYGDEIDRYYTEVEAVTALQACRRDKGLDPDTGERPNRDDVLQEWHEYGLSFDYVAPHTFGKDQNEGYWRYQISWGGPSDEIRFYGTSDGEGRSEFYRAEYWFMDWFDGACRTVTREKAVQWMWDDFNDCGTTHHVYEESMDGYEPPMDEDEDLDPDFEESSND